MGFGSKLKRAAERSVKAPAKAVAKKLGEATADASTLEDLAFETGGFSTLGIGTNLGARAGLAGGLSLAEDVLGIGGDEPEVAGPAPTTTDDPTERRKRVLEAQRRNAPGIRQQSVFTPREK